MGYYSDFREYLGALDRAGKLRTITAVINKDTELHPLVRWQFRGLEEPDRTGWLFENLSGHGVARFPGRVATSVLGPNTEVYALALQCSVDEIASRWAHALAHPIAPTLVDSGPVKQIVHSGASLLEHGGLDEFPIPMATNGWEPLPRLTAVAWHSQDPDTGTTNVGTYNALKLGQLRTNCRVGVDRGLMDHWRKARRRGKPLPVAAVVAPVPAVLMASVATIPRDEDELAVAGGLARESIPVVKCETSDILVPASAEIVIEGVIRTDYTEPDGASGEHTGYTIVDRHVFAFEVSAITHRENPIWQDFMSQMPPSESSTIRGIATEAAMTALLKRHMGIKHVKDLALHHCGGAYRMCVVRFHDVAGRRTPPEVVWQALYGALAHSTGWPKIIIGVDDDIDSHDLESVGWALSFRFQPHRDVRVVQGRSAALDQSSGPPHWSTRDRRYPPSDNGPSGSSAILMDATRKWPYTPVALPKREFMERARVLWQELGLPELRPRTPWYGVELGWWSDPDRRLAALGERGEFDAAARLLLSQGGPLGEDSSL